METHQELPLCSISSAPCPKEAPPVLEKQPPAQESYTKRARELEGNKRGGKPVNGQVSVQPQQENRVMMSTRGEGACQPLTSSMAAAQEQLASTGLLKRKHGRARKHPQELVGEPSRKRPRGRPKGSKNKSPSKAAQKEPTGEPSPKRSRGRPKGSKNKNPSKAAQKKPTEGPYPKRPRGRPKGSKNKGPFQAAQKVPYNRRASGQEGSKRWGTLMSGQEREQSQQANRVLLITQGEESSQPLTSSVAAAQEQSASREPLKRGQGRPRKQPQLPVSFEEMAVCFIKEEQDLMDQGHSSLYKEVRMKDNGNMVSPGGNAQEKERFVEASMRSPETTKTLVEKESFGNQKELKRQKRNKSKNWRKNSSASQEQDICELLTQQENYKGKRRINCSVCGKMFQSKFHLNIHCRIHTVEKPNECMKGGKCCSRTRHLPAYQRTPVEEKSYKCMECGKSFSQSAHLYLHRKTHTVEKPYKCMECGKSFSQNGDLKLHQRTHKGEKPYMCMECGKSFSNHSKLRKHQKTNKREKPYKCTKCGKTFCQNVHLHSHQRAPTDEKPYMCMECGKSFNNSGSLHSHQKIHTGEKSHKCIDCGKTFSFMQTLRSHQRTHTGERPYMCMVCGKSFYWIGSLRLHQRFHTGKKPYKCLKSGRTFSRSASPIFIFPTWWWWWWFLPKCSSAHYTTKFQDPWDIVRVVKGKS